jgi:two-component system sensor histidine kinase ComP
MKRSFFVRVVLFILVAYQIWALFLIFRYPLIGINLQRDPAQQWIISSFEVPSIAPKVDLQIGDVIHEINGKSPDLHESVRLFKSIDQADSILASRGEVPVFVNLSTMSSISTYDIFSLLAEISSLLIAGLLVRKVKSSRSSFYLSGIFLNISVIFMSLITSVRGDPSGKLMIGTFIMFLPVIFYKFLHVYLIEKGTPGFPYQWGKWYCILIAVPVLIQLVYLTGLSGTAPLYGLVRNMILGISIAGIMGVFLVILYFYRKCKKDNQHIAMLVRTVFWSLFLSLSPITLLSFFPRFLFGHEWLSSLQMSWFIFLFPLTFVYLLATRRLYDIDLITRRILFTVVIAIIPSLLFTGTAKLLFGEAANGERLALAFFIQLIGISFVLYILENLTTRLEPALFPRKFRLQLALKSISRNLGTISTFQEMREIILKDIVDTLEVAGAAIMLLEEGKEELIAVGTAEQGHILRMIEEKKQEAAGYVCFAITRQEDYTAYLAVSPKRTGTMLGHEEMHWLQLILTYLAVSLENVQLIRKLDNKIQTLSSLVPKEEEAGNLQWFRKLMFGLQEKERVRIAMDIHDSTMQDLFFLKRRLETVQEEHMLTPEGTKALGQAARYIDMINAGLRQSCFELHPYLLRDIGLVATLGKLLQMERAACEFRIDFNTTEIPPIEELDMEVKQHVFRMVQELLNNAKKYSRASIVCISLQLHTGALKVEYADNGVGFEERRPIVREIGSSGRGIEQMKSRVLSMNGSCELSTSPGKGMTFWARFPAASQLSRA